MKLRALSFHFILSLLLQGMLVAQATDSSDPGSKGCQGQNTQILEPSHQTPSAHELVQRFVARNYRDIFRKSTARVFPKLLGSYQIQVKYPVEELPAALRSQFNSELEAFLKRDGDVLDKTARISSALAQAFEPESSPMATDFLRLFTYMYGDDFISRAGSELDKATRQILKEEEKSNRTAFSEAVNKEEVRNAIADQ